MNKLDLPKPLWGSGFVSPHVEREIRAGTTPPMPVVVAGCLTASEVTALSVSLADVNWKRRSYQGVIDLSVRDCFYAQVPSAKYPLLRRSLVGCLPHIFDGGRVSTRFAAPPLAYRYPPGGGMVVHHDMVTLVEVERARLSGQPVVGGDYTIIWHLNTIEPGEGGELYFPATAQTISPVAGCAVAFRVDVLHGVHPTSSKERHVLVARFFVSGAKS